MAPLSTTPVANETPQAPSNEPAIPYTRLHITPFDLSLQKIVIPASVLPYARNISYHTIETFPEKRFGFVDLPSTDADKLKKKLNGSVLKGTKMRIETAHPEPKSEPAAVADAAEAKAAKKEKKSKKRKHEAGVIEGIQLEGRKVKRGWTTTEKEMIEEKRKRAKRGRDDDKSSKAEKRDKKDKKKGKATVSKSKYTDEPECLFKTKLPAAGPPKESEEVDGEASAPQKKRKRKGDRKVTVHEFEKTTKHPTFLKSTPTGPSTEATTFEDGVGWVDDTGKVVEPVKSRTRPGRISIPPPPKPTKAVPTPQEEEDDDETSSDGSSSDDDDDTSSSGSDSDALNQPVSAVAPQPIKAVAPASSNPLNLAKSESTRPKSSGSTTSLSIKIPTTPSAKKIHPLEALYKRPKGDDWAPESGSNTQPFSFFDNEGDVGEDGGSMVPTSQAPMTPFTKQEFEFRNVRSAAPTPDTAHPSRSFHFWASQDPAEGAEPDEEEDPQGLEDVEEEDQEEADVAMEDRGTDKVPDQTQSSDFQKQFWESRGDLNRAWRKRRKSAAKEKRYRDNRARAERAI